MLFVLGVYMKNTQNKQRDKKSTKNRDNIKWSLTLMVMAALISVVLSFFSEIAMKDVNLLVGTIVILIFIGIGIIFDTIGVAVTSADEAPLHAMSSKKIKGAKLAVTLKKKCDKVSTFCCDVIGDICGIISGAAGVAVATKLSTIFSISPMCSSLIVTGVVAALTIGGKSLEKPLAIANGNNILYRFARILSMFSKK